MRTHILAYVCCFFLLCPWHPSLFLHMCMISVLSIFITISVCRLKPIVIDVTLLIVTSLSTMCRLHNQVSLFGFGLRTHLDLWWRHGSVEWVRGLGWSKGEIECLLLWRLYPLKTIKRRLLSHLYLTSSLMMTQLCRLGGIMYGSCSKCLI